ncbi:MAG: polyribonucleotide nucleotidyltransferase [Verrucomicrobiales bacterium]|jgi:polyribonucleotide nucleotidyltransferase|nr:polyribonucleotide nucleotidyltransferase [Verrucomicrobiales bacterium]MBP9223111.1 polyribonucleotide nucleotidyltransferase [Verrucomicrobiales bacterium]
MSIEKITCQVGTQEMTIETGKMGKLADGAVTVQVGETVVIVTAVSQTKVREGQDWFPLSVEYKEKAAAAGRFPGGYFKREGRPTEKEILTCRMTDRPLRPLFPKGYLYDTQVVALLLSADGVNDADILSINGASAALCVSDIPFAGPVGAVRIGLIGDDFVVNPTFDERLESTLDLVYVGLRDKVIMIEGGGKEVPDEKFKESLIFAQKAIQPLLDAQEELARRVGKPKRTVALMEVQDELLEVAYQVAGDRIEDALYKASKIERGSAVSALRKEVSEAILAKYPEANEFAISQAFDYLQKKAFRISILDKGQRCDGRDIDTIRPLSGEVGVLPRTHGSGLFARGETQALSIATLAPADEKQYFDNYAGGEDSKRFLLHYNFPPFSVGETGRMGGMNRREIGHGALAEKSIEPVIPAEADFPYAIRVSSEVMESNGSTSMASVCSGVMALLDAGVPLIRPVAGISCGLVTEFEGDDLKRYVTMLDIIGNEDFMGDMDFKLCGTSQGVTGFQLDLKLSGLSLDILLEGVDKATKGRFTVLEVMNGIISAPKALSEHAPRIETIKIDPQKIGELIGPGGKNIKGIQAETGADINISDDGTVSIYAAHQEALNRAIELVRRTTAEIEVGKTYYGKVVSTTNFGAFVEVLPGKDGMVHVSELADFRVNEVTDVVKVGDMIYAKCIGVDERGRVKLSRKAAMAEKGIEAAAELSSEG